MRTILIAAAIVIGLAPAFGRAQATLPGTAQMPAPAERKLQLSFDGQGGVTLVAQNVTIRDILIEWTRLGGCQFVNAEKLAPEPLVLQFENEPEITVLNTLLRRAAGVIVSPRTTRTAGASRFELVQILATSSPVATGSFTPSVSPAPLQTPGSAEDEIPPVRPVLNPNAPPAATQPAPDRPTVPTVGIPGQGVFVPIQAVPPPGSPTVGAPTTQPPPVTTTGRGGRGGGGR